MSSSFISGPPREGATLHELMAYLRPKSDGAISAELHQHFQARAHPQPEGDTRFAGILGELGIPPQEFAQLALSRPELWDRDQLEYLETIAGGYPHNDLIYSLAEEFFTEAAAPPPQLLEQPLEDEDDVDVDGDVDPIRSHEGALTALFASAKPALTPLKSETLPVVGDTADDWWKKK